MDGQEHEGMSVNRQPQLEQQSLLLASGHAREHEHHYIFRNWFNRNPNIKGVWTAIEFAVFLYFAINTSLAFDTGLQQGINLAYSNRYNNENITEAYLNSSTAIADMFLAVNYECSCTSSTCGLTMPLDSR
jgi:hypothetical protein